MTETEARLMLHNGASLSDVLEMLQEEQKEQEELAEQDMPVDVMIAGLESEDDIPYGAVMVTKDSLIGCIDKVIFNDPATIIIWKDRSRTVVQTQGDEKFDPEKGLAMALLKRILGNNREYYGIFRKYCKNARKGK